MANKGIIPKVRIEGAELFIKNCDMLTVNMHTAVEKTLKELGFKIANDAKILCPVDTGRLRASLTVNWSGSKMERAPIKKPSTKERNASKADDGIGQPKGPGGFQVAVGTNVAYAESVHKRVPYLKAAWHQNAVKYKHKLESACRGAIKI